MADWARLLSECRGLNLGRGFESRPPRHKKNASEKGAFFASAAFPMKNLITLISWRHASRCFSRNTTRVTMKLLSGPDRITSGPVGAIDAIGVLR